MFPGSAEELVEEKNERIVGAALASGCKWQWSTGCRSAMAVRGSGM